MLRNLEEVGGKVEFKAPLILTAPTYNIIEELKLKVKSLVCHMAFVFKNLKVSFGQNVF